MVVVGSCAAVTTGQSLETSEKPSVCDLNLFQRCSIDSDLMRMPKTPREEEFSALRGRGLRFAATWIPPPTTLAKSSLENVTSKKEDQSNANIATTPGLVWERRVTMERVSLFSCKTLAQLAHLRCRPPNHAMSAIIRNLFQRVVKGEGHLYDASRCHRRPRSRNFVSIKPHQALLIYCTYAVPS